MRNLPTMISLGRPSWRSLSFVLTLPLLFSSAVAHADDPIAKGPANDVHQMLMRKFEAMNDTDQGIFHDDVTALLAPVFPVGQLQAETRKIVAEQKLGELRPFMGTNDTGMGDMFVTRFDLVGRLSEHVYVVVDFDFDKASDGKSRLKQMKAFFRAPAM